jgi:hypothetical protein
MFPGLDMKELQLFRETYGASAFVCRYLHCSLSTDGFDTWQQRERHESQHQRKFRCAHPTCAYFTTGFANRLQLNRHNRRYHASNANETSLFEAIRALNISLQVSLEEKQEKVAPPVLVQEEEQKNQPAAPLLRPEQIRSLPCYFGQNSNQYCELRLMELWDLVEKNGSETQLHHNAKREIITLSEQIMQGVQAIQEQQDRPPHNAEGAPPDRQCHLSLPQQEAAGVMELTHRLIDQTSIEEKNKLRTRLYTRMDHRTYRRYQELAFDPVFHYYRSQAVTRLYQEKQAEAQAQAQGLSATPHTAPRIQRPSSSNGQQQHQNDRSFKCDQCPQSFNSKHDLKLHKPIHFLERIKPAVSASPEPISNQKTAPKPPALAKDNTGAPKLASETPIDWATNPTLSYQYPPPTVSDETASQFDGGFADPYPSNYPHNLYNTSSQSMTELQLPPAEATSHISTLFNTYPTSSGANANGPNMVPNFLPHLEFNSLPAPSIPFELPREPSIVSHMEEFTLPDLDKLGENPARSLFSTTGARPAHANFKYFQSASGPQDFSFNEFSTLTSTDSYPFSPNFGPSNEGLSFSSSTPEDHFSGYPLLDGANSWDWNFETPTESFSSTSPYYEPEEATFHTDWRGNESLLDPGNTYDHQALKTVPQQPEPQSLTPDHMASNR